MESVTNNLVSNEGLFEFKTIKFDLFLQFLFL